jgi:methionyl-tRNA formyltransferase
MVTSPEADALRVVFFGTPAFAVPSLEALLRSRHAVVGVVTQPDRPSGRGQKINASPVKSLADSAALPLLQPQKLRDASFLDELRAWRPDVGVVAAYGKILTDEVLSLPPRGLINVHGSLLPLFRGAAPVHRAVIAGERETGVTIMRVVKALDAGPMLAKAPRPIDPDETSEDVERDLARLGAGLLMVALDDIAAGRQIEEPQDEIRATYAHKVTKDDGAIDWEQPAERIHNLIRGLHPWPHAFSFLHGRRFILLRSRWSSGPRALPPGTVAEAAGERLTVATGSGLLHVVEIQPEGRRPMTARDFLAGRPISPGDRFARA